MRGSSLRSVAKAVGVSVTTVSNAYNKPDHLSAELREEIFAVARSLGYAGPDPAARSLRSGRTGAIGVLLTAQLPYAFSDPYCVELLAGLAEVAESNRTSILLIPLATPTAASDEEMRQSLQAVRYAVIDGAVADGIDGTHPAAQVMMDRGIPLIWSVESALGRCVVIEEKIAGRAIGEHLAGLGHRDVLVVVDAVPGAGGARDTVDESELFPYSRLRMAGIRDGLGDGARMTAVAAERNTIEAGRTVAELILGRSALPTAIAAVSDVLALGVIDVLSSRGHAIGGAGVSVSGFDDVPAAAAAGLTTVRQPIRDKGRTMGRMLLDPSFLGQRVVLPTELVARTSTSRVR